MKKSLRFSCLVVVLSLVTSAFAQTAAPANPPPAAAATPPPPAQPAPPPPEARQFDFWVGDWEVFGPAGVKIGTNKITLIANGNALLENWTDMRGGSGMSLNSYKRRTKQWQQYWVGSGGGTTEYYGGLVDGKMIMIAHQNIDGQGRNFMMRGIWTPNADGTVTQVFETSYDQGLTWTGAFHGTYKRVAPAATP